MAGARTAIDMSTAWTCDLEIPAQTYSALDKATTDHVTATFFTADAVLENDGGNVGNPKWAASVLAAGQTPPSGPGQHATYDMYYPFRLRIIAGGVMSQVGPTYWVLAGQTEQYFPYVATMPSGATLVTSLSIPVSFGVEGLYVRRVRTSSPPPKRQLLDFTDQTITDSWWADTATEVTVSGDGMSDSHGLTYSDEEVEIGSNFNLSAEIHLNNAPTASTVYGKISNITWALAAGGSQVDLYNPGDAGDIPNGTVAPGWSRTWTTNDAFHVSAGNDIEMDHLSGTSSSGTFDMAMSAPVMVAVTPWDEMFDMDGGAYDPDIVFTSNFIGWIGSTSYVTEFSGHHAETQSATSWLRKEEYQKLSSNAIQVRVTTDWREQNVEDVGSDSDDYLTETRNDIRCGLLACGIDATGASGDPHWDGGISWGQYETQDVLNTEGQSIRGSHWVAGGGATLDPGDEDVWIVSPGSTAPTVTRTLSTRYWLRMDRLAELQDDPDAEHLQDWPIMHLANIDIGQTGDDPDWWDPNAGGVEVEDVYCWANYRYLKLGFESPRDGSITIDVDYDVVDYIYDPCYTSFEWRFGLEGFWEYERSARHVTYHVDLDKGTSTYSVDLYSNDEGIHPVGANRMQVVGQIRITLPPNSSGSDETWHITDLMLSHDFGDSHSNPQRSEPDTHMLARFAPSWRWLVHPNPDDETEVYEDWFGFGGTTDGKDVLELVYGYGDDSIEGKLLYIQKSRHDPDSEIQDLMDYAKPLSRWASELSWQQGFWCTYPDPTPEESVHNMDSDSGQVDGTFRWWDMQQSTEASGPDMPIALCAGTYNVVAGVSYDIMFHKHPRGRIHGILLTDDGVAVRDETDVIEHYEVDDDGNQTLVGLIGTDEHGRFRTSPARELRTHRLVTPDDDWTGIEVRNRQYTTVGVIVIRGGIARIVTDGMGAVWRIYVSYGQVTVDRMQPTTASWTDSVKVGAGSSTPSISVDPDTGIVVATAGTIAGTALWTSCDRRSFTGVQNMFCDDLDMVDVDSHLGAIHAVGWNSIAGTIEYRRASDLSSGVADVTITVSTPASSPTALSISVSRADGAVCVMASDSSDSRLYMMRNHDAGFVEVV